MHLFTFWAGLIFSRGRVQMEVPSSNLHRVESIEGWGGVATPPRFVTCESTKFPRCCQGKTGAIRARGFRSPRLSFERAHVQRGSDGPGSTAKTSDTLSLRCRRHRRIFNVGVAGRHPAWDTTARCVIRSQCCH